MSEQLMNLVEKASMKEELPYFEIGDTVDVHCRILEGEKERIQIFTGVVIARSGSGRRAGARRAPRWVVRGWNSGGYWCSGWCAWG